MPHAIWYVHLFQGSSQGYYWVDDCFSTLQDPVPRVGGSLAWRKCCLMKCYVRMTRQRSKRDEPIWWEGCTWCFTPGCTNLKSFLLTRELSASGQESKILAHRHGNMPPKWTCKLLCKREKTHKKTQRNLASTVLQWSSNPVRIWWRMMEGCPLTSPKAVNGDATIHSRKKPASPAPSTGENRGTCCSAVAV